jgi:hypothetical protein
MIKIWRFINLLQYKSNTLPYIDYSIGTYQKKMLPNVYISTNHLHRLRRNNCFSANENEYFYSKIIRTLHVQISPFTVKYTPSSCLCAVDVRKNQFVVAHFLPIHLKGVSYTRFQQVVGRNFGRNKVQFWGVGLLFMSINLTSR